MTDEKAFTKARLITIMQLVVAPAVYLVIAHFLVKIEPHATTEEVDTIFYVLIGLAMAGPAVAFIYEKFQISAFRKQPNSKMTVSKLLLSLAIAKAAFVGAIFVYGFISYLMSSDMMRMLLFYPIGAVWAAIHWPRRDKWENQLQSLEMP